MGSCFSTTKVSGSNSNNTPPAAVNGQRKESNKPAPITTKNQDGSNHNQQKTQHKKDSKQIKPKRQGGIIPCGKKTDFGYDKDFDKRYTIGKLLGHGQFGYTYVGVDKFNGDRVAVKKIDKNKVFVFLKNNELSNFRIGFCLFGVCVCVFFCAKIL